ncbi:MAG: hypothetical protein PHG27_09760 [Massilibacteroides sp.]|nr:hypothetical protein [Massilibacteroides sp.]MDD4115858.1 hypothetical protein [Massilibacteroides sp.]
MRVRLGFSIVIVWCLRSGLNRTKLNGTQSAPKSMPYSVCANDGIYTIDVFHF